MNECPEHDLPTQLVSYHICQAAYHRLPTISFTNIREIFRKTLWSVDGDTDGRDSLLTNSMQTYCRQTVKPTVVTVY